jgi:hypothetical protein
MRFALRATLVATALVLGGVVGAAPTSAVALNSVTVAKTVVGTPPSGTTFAVTLTCGASVHVVNFDASGNATNQATFGEPLGTTCSVNETTNGGATSVAYACANTTPSDTQVTCGSDGTSVQFGDTNTGAATLTVTNTFEPPTTTTTQPPQQTNVAPAAVEASPTFTG